MLFIFLQLLLEIFCCGPPLFFLKHCRAVHRRQIGNKKVTTYIKYIIAPALYLQTQIIMGATKKKNTQIRRFLDSGRVVLGGRFVAATESLASSTSKCATPAGTPQARNVVAGVRASSRNRENPFFNKTVVYCSYPFLSMKACMGAVWNATQNIYVKIFHFQQMFTALNTLNSTTQILTNMGRALICDLQHKARLRQFVLNHPSLVTFRQILNAAPRRLTSLHFVGRVVLENGVV